MKNKFVLVLILLISIIGIKALLKPGFYTSHDGRHQIIRLMHFHKGLEDGQFPVRWAGTALEGYGYPLFIFTYRLPFWIAEAYYLIFPNLGNAIKFVFLVGFVLSGITFYWLSLNLFKSKFAGFVASFLYLWAPYRFVNIFVRASLGEATSFIFIPLIFLGLFKLGENLKREKKLLVWEILTGFFLAGLILSHAIILTIWFIPFLFWFSLNLTLCRNTKKYFFATLNSVLVSLLLSAYYWIPALVEKKYVSFASTINDYYKTHFVTLKQLIYSKWGYGFSMGGTKQDMMSFQVGIAQWLVVVVAFIVILISIIRRRKAKLNKLTKNYFNITHLQFKYLFVFLIAFLVSLYLMLPVSDWFYNFISKYQAIDIPWRFLGVSIFFAALIAGLLINIIKNKILKLLFVFIIMLLAFYGNRNHLRVNKYIYNPDSEYWQSSETSSEHEDYKPKDFNSSQFKKTDPDLVTLNGLTNNKVMLRKSNLLRFYSEVGSNKAEVVSKIAYYPGWEAYINNKKGKIEQTDGRIKVSLERGNNLVTLLFRETKLRRFSNWLSLITFISLTFLLVKYGKKET